ncbi:MAG: putative toxin-antitoxin system toxin component, PIN family [Nitrospirae bacterium]|nr:putative toxin-antitoxin system toxin component, PIN family [Nitrospirota bacterium]
MRVVLDTNVIISAFATRGLSAEVFEVCLTDHNIVISEHILSEVKEKLISKIRLPQGIVQDVIAYLREQAEICSPEEINSPLLRDKDDADIIGTALSGNVRFIITGDKDLLILKKYKGIKIITPREFWNYLRR